MNPLAYLVAALWLIILARLFLSACAFVARKIRSWIAVRRFIRARRNRPLAERVKDAEDQMDEIYPGFTAAFRAEMSRHDRKDGGS